MKEDFPSEWGAGEERKYVHAPMCLHCNGSGETGRIPNRGACPVCKGKGYIESIRARVNRIVEALLGGD